MQQERTGSDFMLDALDHQIRSSALGKVAAALAEMHRRRLLQQQTSKVDEPPDQETTSLGYGRLIGHDGLFSELR